MYSLQPKYHKAHQEMGKCGSLKGKAAKAVPKKGHKADLLDRDF